MDELGGLSNSVANIPDLKYVIDTLTQIFTFISSDEMITMRHSSKDEYDRILREKFPDFYTKYYSLFNVILSGELDSMTHLVMMIKTLCLVKSGNITMDEAFANIREELSNKYIYPQFGGKKAFERKIIERSKNHKR